MSRALPLLLSLCALVLPATARAHGRVDVRVPARASGAVEASARSRVGSPEFLQRDPEGYVDSVNQYAAMANDPVNNRDPTGRTTETYNECMTTPGTTPEYCAEMHLTQAPSGCSWSPASPRSWCGRDAAANLSDEVDRLWDEYVTQPLRSVTREHAVAIAEQPGRVVLPGETSPALPIRTITESVDDATIAGSEIVRDAIKTRVVNAAAGKAASTVKSVVRRGRAARSSIKAVAGGGATLNNISTDEARRIQNAANRIGRPITLVGSRAGGKALHPGSDWDYIVHGATSKQRASVRRSLPGARDIAEGNGRDNIDFFKEELDRSRPHITFYPVR